MPDYAEILAFLANNPPQLAAERQLHASLLELMAQCLRSDHQLPDARPGETARCGPDVGAQIADGHVRRVHYS